MCPCPLQGRTKTPPTGYHVSQASTPRTCDSTTQKTLNPTPAPNRAIAAADACYANDFGCGLHQLGLTEMIVENSRWDSGASRILNASVHHLTLHRGNLSHTRPLPPCGRGAPQQGATHPHVVARVGHRLHCRRRAAAGSGGKHAALPVCHRDGQPAHVAAQRAVLLATAATGDGLGGAASAHVQRHQGGHTCACILLTCTHEHSSLHNREVKHTLQQLFSQVILAFARPIWPQGFFDVVCLDCFVPEFWVTQYQHTTPNGAALHGITGFLAGAAAEVASALAPEEILARTLAQLDTMFGTFCPYNVVCRPLDVCNVWNSVYIY